MPSLTLPTGDHDAAASGDGASPKSSSAGAVVDGGHAVAAGAVAPDVDAAAPKSAAAAEPGVGVAGSVTHDDSGVVPGDYFAAGDHGAGAMEMGDAAAPEHAALSAVDSENATLATDSATAVVAAGAGAAASPVETAATQKSAHCWTTGTIA